LLTSALLKAYLISSLEGGADIKNWDINELKGVNLITTHRKLPATNYTTPQKEVQSLAGALLIQEIEVLHHLKLLAEKPSD